MDSWGGKEDGQQVNGIQAVLAVKNMPAPDVLRTTEEAP